MLKMKKVICTLFVVWCFFSTNAQLAFQHTYTIPNDISVIDLLLSGKKYCVRSGNQTVLYNLDHSVWKTINMPVIPGLYPGALGIQNYISENLFKIDNKVDMVVCYGDSANMSSGMGPKQYVIFDEDGLIINNIDSVDWNFEIHNIGADSFVAFVNKWAGPAFGTNIVSVYKLPGTLPCNPCGAGPGLAISTTSSSDNSGLLLNLVPNPSSSSVRIEYNLRPGITAVIQLFDGHGQLIRSYNVDHTFNYLMLDNSSLASGTYYYSITTSDHLTTARKMIVIK